MPKKLSPTEWVAKVNAIAATAKKKEVVMGATVRVLVRCVLNGADHKSLGWCNPGDIITVAGVAARGLVEKGFVTRELVEAAPAQPVFVPEKKPDATASARKLAASLCIDLASVVGTGSGGRIIKSDVQAFVQRTDEGE